MTIDLTTPEGRIKAVFLDGLEIYRNNYPKTVLKYCKKLGSIVDEKGKTYRPTILEGNEYWTVYTEPPKQKVRKQMENQNNDN